MRVLVAIATAAMLLVGVAAPHHHAAGAPSHDCVACTVGSGLEARDATPAVEALAPAPLARVEAPAQHARTGAPLGAVPGQSPPA